MTTVGYFFFEHIRLLSRIDEKLLVNNVVGHALNYVFMYLIVSGMNNRNSTEYMKTMHLTFKVIFLFLNSTLNRIIRLIETI